MTSTCLPTGALRNNRKVLADFLYYSTQNFTWDEDKLICRWAETRGTRSWTQFLRLFVLNKTPEQVRNRYEKVLKIATFKGKWSTAEDDQLTRLLCVIKSGTKRRWCRIAWQLKTRNSKQIAERAARLTQTDPTWTPDQTELLRRAAREFEFSWARIARELFQTKCANTVKNHFYALIRRARDDDSDSE
jgi:hypothetical protein